MVIGKNQTKLYLCNKIMVSEKKSDYTYVTKLWWVEKIRLDIYLDCVLGHLLEVEHRLGKHQLAVPGNVRGGSDNHPQISLLLTL